jgi:4-hydroxybenzoate polyprenyltransferase
MTSLPSQLPTVDTSGIRACMPAALRAMRPRQWTKNLLLLAGLLFAGKAADTGLWLDAIGGVAAFCALSSAAYLVNDVHDVSHDRMHPMKRFRPVARGDISFRFAWLIAACLAVIALSLAALLGARFVVLLASFGALQLAYTFALKRVPIVDVATIAAAFALRAAAGAAAVEVRTSPWLPICAVLLAMFLGFAKRRGELVLAGTAQRPARPVLRLYNLALLDVLVWIAAAATIAVYTLYTIAAHDQKELVATVPFVAFGVGRYLQLVHRDDLGEEPEQVLLRDAPILAAAIVWALTATWILTVS